MAGWRDGIVSVFIIHTKCVSTAWRWGLILFFSICSGGSSHSNCFLPWLPPWSIRVDSFYLIEGCSLRLTWLHGLLVCHGNILGTFWFPVFYISVSVRSCMVYIIFPPVSFPIYGAFWSGGIFRLFSFGRVGLCNKWAFLFFFFFSLGGKNIASIIPR